MTVSSTSTKNSYSGDGSTTVFAYTFKIFDDDDIIVILRTDATGGETVQTKGTHYSVSGVGNAGGGNITFVTAPASGITVVLIRATVQTQTTDYTPNDPFPAASHEDALDRLTLMVQDQQEELDRAIKVSRTNTITSSEFTIGPSDRANKVFAFDANGDFSVTQEIGTYKGTDTTTTTSAYSARDIVKSTTAAQLDNVYIATQNSPEGTLLTNTTYWQLLIDAVSAAASAAAAASSATDAENAQTAAESAQAAAETAQTNAETAETNAEAAQTAAEAAQAAAELALDNFTDTYLGAFASDPTVDNDGNPLTTGDLYFNTTSNELKVYNGSAWQVAAISADGLLASANNLSDVASAATAIANLGISATAAELNVLDGITASTAELNYTDGVTSAIQTQLDAKLALAGGTLTGAAIGSTQTASVTGSTTLDFSTYQNFVLTMTGNVTLDNPTTETVGQSGFIIFSQTAGYTVSLGTDYETAGGAGITLSASGDDIVPYVVAASGRILLGAPQLAFA
jgi:hypothetical protein